MEQLVSHFTEEVKAECSRCPMTEIDTLNGLRMSGWRLFVKSDHPPEGHDRTHLAICGNCCRKYKIRED